MATALTIGMFDGVHVGHRKIIDQARTAVGSEGHVAVVTFEPAPAVVLSPEDAFPRLMTDRQRQSILKSVGVDSVHVINPTREFLQQSPAAFIDHILGEYQPSFILEGHDFRFGSRREGDVQMLRAAGAVQGFEVILIDDIKGQLSDGSTVPVRSSVIRDLIRKGRVNDAARLLGRSWQLEGLVVQGHQRGREIGCPTANLDVGNLILPADGVYAGRAYLESGDTHVAAISVGTNPTFEDAARTCEIHLLDFDGVVGDYNWPLKVDIDHWIREQLIFDSLDSLKKAMSRDLERVQHLMSV